MFRTSRSAATAGLVLAATLAAGAGTAVAAPPGPGCMPVVGSKPAYPPGLCKKGISDSAPAAGQAVRASTNPGSFDPGTRVVVGVHSTFVELGWTTADGTGAAAATVTIPADLPPGQHHLVFEGRLHGTPTEVSIPITVTRAAAGSVAHSSASRSASASRSLPYTGGEVAELALVGGVLVAAGAGSVVVGRRRRQGSVA